MMDSLGNIRNEYQKDALEEQNLPEEPFTLFNRWLEDALQSDQHEPTAMALSTLEQDGQPSSRIVLLKKIEEGKFVFFTNYNSRKARDIHIHPRVSALFFWSSLERQVKITGVATRIDDNESTAYFHSRPIESQIGAWASPQSKEIPDREYLEKAFARYVEEFKETDPIPKPPHWGGYAIIPSRIEFWQGRKARLHDRIEYRKANDSWERVRLSP